MKRVSCKLRLLNYCRYCSDTGLYNIKKYILKKGCRNQDYQLHIETQNNQRAGVPLLWGKAERVGLAQPGEGCRETLLQYLKGAYKKDGDRLFCRASCNRTRGHGFKLKEGRLRLGIRTNFFTVRVVKHRNRLPREMVDAPSLETFKVRLDGALSNLL